MKIVFVGDANVGKSALFHKFVTNQTLTETEATVGVEFKRLKLSLPAKEGSSDSQDVPLVLWDTAGQEKFRSVTTHQYRGTNGAILVYDITSPNSLRNLKQWIEEVVEHAVEGVVMVIVANKCDNYDSLGALESGRSLALEKGISFYQTSTHWDKLQKNDDNNNGIACIVQSLAEQILKKQGFMEDRAVLRLSDDNPGCNKQLIDSCAC